MLEKEKIIKGLKSDNEYLYNYIFEYVSMYRLYDDKEINKELIECINKNYNDLPIYMLKYNTLNKEIIEALIKLHESINNDKIKSSIEIVLLHNYNLLKEMDYNYNSLFVDREDRLNNLIYRRIKHFEKKDEDFINELYDDLYVKYLSDNYTNVDKAFTNALNIVSTLDEKRHENAVILYNQYMENILEDIKDLEQDCINFFLLPLLMYKDDSYVKEMLDLYITIIKEYQIVDLMDEFFYYFSNVEDEEFYTYFIEKYNENKYMYELLDLASYIKSEKIDEVLINSYKNSKNQEEKNEILNVLAGRFNKECLSYAKDYIRNIECDLYSINSFEPIVCLLLLEEPDEEITKEAIKKIEDHNRNLVHI